MESCTCRYKIYVYISNDWSCAHTIQEVGRGEEREEAREREREILRGSLKMAVLQLQK